MINKVGLWCGEIRVRFAGAVQTPSFNSVGAAEAHLDMLERSARAPSPISFEDAQLNPRSQS